mgnify:CR=1 FL=1
MDEVEGVLFCLLNMLYYNSTKKTVETEQISIVLGQNFCDDIPGGCKPRCILIPSEQG